MTDRVVYLVTGAIGAGKTTFSRHLLPLLESVEYIGADFYFYPYFLNSKKPEYLCYEDAKEYARYKVTQTLRQGRSFVLEKTFSDDGDLWLFDLFSQYGYRVVAFFMIVDSLEILQKRTLSRSQDGWYCVPPEKVERHWYRAQNVLALIRANSDCFYAIDTTEGYRFVLCEENKRLLYMGANCSSSIPLTDYEAKSPTTALSECSPFLQSVYRHMSDISYPEECKVVDSMVVLEKYTTLCREDLLEIERIRSCTL